MFYPRENGHPKLLPLTVGLVRWDLKVVRKAHNHFILQFDVVLVVLVVEVHQTFRPLPSLC